MAIVARGDPRQPNLLSAAAIAPVRQARVAIFAGRAHGSLIWHVKMGIPFDEPVDLAANI
jgi:hypothetical protein